VVERPTRDHFAAGITVWMLVSVKKHHPHKVQPEFSGREQAYLKAKEKLPPTSTPVNIPLPHRPESLKIYPSGKRTIIREQPRHGIMSGVTGCSRPSHG
jgi:hypothetical protein